MGKIMSQYLPQAEIQFILESGFRTMKASFLVVQLARKSLHRNITGGLKATIKIEFS